MQGTSGLLLVCLPPHMRRPELAAPAPGSVSSREGPGQREHGPSNDPCPRCRQGHLALALAGSPQMLSSRPNSSPHSKGVRCHRGAQNADKQTETSNCAALAPQISQPPSSTPDPGQGTRRRVSTPARRVRSRHAQAETTRCPAGPGDWEVLTLSSPRRSSGQLRTGLPHALLHARPATRAGSPRPGPTTAAPGGTLGPRTPRPARAGERRGRPARGREGGTDRGTEDRRPLPTSVRASVAPAQPLRRSLAHSSARPAPAAAHALHPGPRHPPTRGRPRAAPAAGRAAPSAAGAGERERANAERANAERARNGHGSGTKRAGARARGAGGRGARVRGGRREREGAG